MWFTMTLQHQEKVCCVHCFMFDSSTADKWKISLKKYQRIVNDSRFANIIHTVRWVQCNFMPPHNHSSLSHLVVNKQPYVLHSFFFIISYMLPMWKFSLTMENWESLNAFTQGSNSLKVSLPSFAHIIALLNRQTSNNFVPPWSAALGKDCVYCSFKARYSHIKPKCCHLKITTSLQWCWTSLLSPIIFRIIYRRKILN